MCGVIDICIMVNDIQRIGKVNAAINNMVSVGLMQAMDDKPNVYVIRAILQLRDKRYMRNWCRNILRVWCLSNAGKLVDKDVNEVELVVFDKETGDLICRFSENRDLLFS